ncbi:MAG TPA: hypothetical protein VGM39_22395 [Kofleriaceae bacterium]|jgi:hypothetical protein
MTTTTITTNYPSGAVKSTETYLRGALHGESITYFPSGKVQKKCTYRHGALDGEMVKYFENGDLDYQVKYVASRDGFRWKARKEGRELSLYEGGRVALECTWVNGVIHGPAVENNEGSRNYERTYVYGIREGVDRDWDEEELTETQWLHGCEAEKVTPKKLAALVTKLKKKKGRDKLDVFEDVTDDDEVRARLMLHMLRDDLITGADTEQVWEDLAKDPAVTGDDVVKILSKVKKLDENADRCLLWTKELDELVCTVYARDPAPLDKALPQLTAEMRDAVRTVRVRFGHAEKFETDMAVALATLQASDGLTTSRTSEDQYARFIHWFRDGELQQISLSSTEDANIPSEQLYELVEKCTTRDAFAKALLAVCLAETSQLPVHRIGDAIRIATPAQFGKLLANDVVGGSLLGFALTKLRKDPPEMLLRWATETDSAATKTVLAFVAAQRFIAAKQPVPAEVDELVTTSGLDNELAYADVLAGLPRDRATAIVTRMFDSLDSDTHLALSLAAPFASPELVETILALFDESAGSFEAASAVATLPPTMTLPHILAAHEATGGEKRAFWKLALYSTLAGMADRGEGWDESIDENLHFGPYEEGEDSMPAPHAEALRRILPALPLDRAQPVFDRAFAKRRTLALRTFVALAAHPVESILRPAFSLLLPDKMRFERGATDIIERGLASLGETGKTWAKWVLDNRKRAHADVTDAFAKTFDKTFWLAYHDQSPHDGEDDEPNRNVERIEELQEMLARLSGSAETTTLHALIQMPDTDGTFNLIGGVPPGFTAENWPTREDEPMQFVCMLDLDTLPAVRASSDYGDTRAIALFMSNPDNNDAYEPGTDQVQVVELTAAQLGTPGVAPDGLDERSRYGIQVASLEVPVITLSNFSADDEELDEEASQIYENLKAVRRKIYQLQARAGGEPIWLQSAEHYGDFVMQIDETFTGSMNLGDSGVLYLFRDTAFWQCH